MKLKLTLIACILFTIYGCKKETKNCCDNNSNQNNDTTEILDTIQETGGIADPIAEINSTPEIVMIHANAFPSNVLLDMPPAKSQGNQGSCGAWATVYYLHSYLKHKAEGTSYTKPNGNDNDAVLSSPSYTFNQMKKGNCGGGSGALVHLSYLKNQGACSLEDMPYSAPSCAIQPTANQKALAANNKISSYFKINRHNVNLVKTILNLEMPIVMAISSDKALHQLPANHVWIPNNISPSGHMVTMCGYNTQGYTFINSWGKKWGNKGKFYIPYNEFAQFPKNDGFIAFWASNPALDNLNNGKESEYLLNANANNTGNGSNGTGANVTGTNNRKGTTNSAVNFNGNNSNISLTENINSNAFSISIWFNKSNTNKTKQTIFSQLDKQNDPNKNIEIYIEDDSLVIDVPTSNGRYLMKTDTTLIPNNWYHLVLTFDSKFLRFYLNGKVIKMGVYMTYFKNTNNQTTLGCSLSNSSGIKDDFFEGKIDDLKTYSRAIKETEVDKLFAE